ncbi:MAG: hypothetical protein IT498_10745 [Rubrivivax sp.]|nr:hypothetical protein [Rubrivivax sp.]MCZ2090239.1 hypothetical protein [Burkholderiales bacterium]
MLKSDRVSSLLMEIPTNPEIPFFAYGAFRPGELAFLKIREFVDRCEQDGVPGTLRIRDGLPIADLASTNSQIDGFLIFFREGTQEEAHKKIVELEPDKQYEWKPIQSIGGQTANILAGLKPRKGSKELEEPWTGKNDPLFTSALEVIDEVLDDIQNHQSTWDLKPLFRLEMAYLLLWTAIERYASLRYHLYRNANQKVEEISTEMAFQNALRKYVKSEPDGNFRTVNRADNPEESYKLDPGNPKKSIKYYYQVRSNLTHRGKGIHADHHMMLSSLQELIAIFRETLAAAFAKSAQMLAENRGAASASS